MDIKKFIKNQKRKLKNSLSRKKKQKSIVRDKMKYLFVYDDDWIEYQYKIFLKYIDDNKKIYDYDGSNYSFEEFLHYQDRNRFLNLSNIKIPSYGASCFDFWIPFECYSGIDYYQIVMDGLHKSFYRDDKIIHRVRYSSILL